MYDIYGRDAETGVSHTRIVVSQEKFHREETDGYRGRMGSLEERKSTPFSIDQHIGYLAYAPTKTTTIHPEDSPNVGLLSNLYCITILNTNFKKIDPMQKIVTSIWQIALFASYKCDEIVGKCVYLKRTLQLEKYSSFLFIHSHWISNKGIVYVCCMDYKFHFVFYHCISIA